MGFGVSKRFFAVSLVAAAASLYAGLGSHAEAATCGSALIKKSTGGYWQCTFADEFDGSALNRNKWVPQRTDSSGFWDGTACYVDDPQNVAVSNGTLKLTARKEAAPFYCKYPYSLW